LELAGLAQPLVRREVLAVIHQLLCYLHTVA
jgi:hypothetical protein